MTLYPKKRDAKRKRPYEHLFTQVVATASKKCLPMSLTYEEFFEFTQIPECFYCGETLIWHMHSFAHQKYICRTNLDRKDNKQGYHKENLVACCPRCNFGKADRYTHEEWVAMANALREFRRSRNLLGVVIPVIGKGHEAC